MATFKWSTPTSAGNVITTQLSAIANNSRCSAVPYDNSTNRDLYARVAVSLGTITPAAGGSITFRVVQTDPAVAYEDPDSSQDSYTAVLATGAGAKRVVFPNVRLYPFQMGFTVINNSGVTLNASNAVALNPYNESDT